MDIKLLAIKNQNKLKLIEKRYATILEINQPLKVKFSNLKKNIKRFGEKLKNPNVLDLNYKEDLTLRNELLEIYISLCDIEEKIYQKYPLIVKEQKKE